MSYSLDPINWVTISKKIKKCIRLTMQCFREHCVAGWRKKKDSLEVFFPIIIATFMYKMFPQLKRRERYRWVLVKKTSHCSRFLKVQMYNLKILADCFNSFPDSSFPCLPCAAMRQTETYRVLSGSVCVRVGGWVGGCRVGGGVGERLPLTHMLKWRATVCHFYRDTKSAGRKQWQWKANLPR